MAQLPPAPGADEGFGVFWQGKPREPRGQAGSDGMIPKAGIAAMALAAAAEARLVPLTGTPGP